MLMCYKGNKNIIVNLTFKDNNMENYKRKVNVVNYLY
jgi:hypothetical protein